MMDHLNRVQPELGILRRWHQAVVVAGLCHDLGHGPCSHTLEDIAKRLNIGFDHEAMGCEILRRIVRHHDTGLTDEVVDAACAFIGGQPYGDWPRWLSQLVSNSLDDIDIDKIDYISRDAQRCQGKAGGEFLMLIEDCRVMTDGDRGGRLAWHLRNAADIDELFRRRVWQFRVYYAHADVQGLELVYADMFGAASEAIGLPLALTDVDLFLRLTDDVTLRIDRGECGRLAQELAVRIGQGRGYPLVSGCDLEVARGSDLYDALRIRGRRMCEIEAEVAPLGGAPPEAMRIVVQPLRYGIGGQDPLASVPFWSEGCQEIIRLPRSQLPQPPVDVVPVSIRCFCADDRYATQSRLAFRQWVAQARGQIGGG
jgi:hypothetical protein